MSTHSVIRTADLHANDKARSAANKEYYMVYVATSFNENIPCLLTQDDVAKGIERAIHNPEDVEKLSVLKRLYLRVVGWLTYAQA